MANGLIKCSAAPRDEKAMIEGCGTVASFCVASVQNKERQFQMLLWFGDALTLTMRPLTLAPDKWNLQKRAWQRSDRWIMKRTVIQLFVFDFKDKAAAHVTGQNLLHHLAKLVLKFVFTPKDDCFENDFRHPSIGIITSIPAKQSQCKSWNNIVSQLLSSACKCRSSNTDNKTNQKWDQSGANQFDSMNDLDKFFH